MFVLYVETVLPVLLCWIVVLFILCFLYSANKKIATFIVVFVRFADKETCADKAKIGKQKHVYKLIKVKNLIMSIISLNERYKSQA